MTRPHRVATCLFAAAAMAAGEARSDVLIIAADFRETHRLDVKQSLEETRIPLGQIDIYRASRDNILIDGTRIVEAEPIPTLRELLAYDALLVYSNAPWHDRVQMGNVVAAYLQAGGGIVTAWNNTDSPLIAGWDGFDPLRSMDFANGPELTVGAILERSHPLFRNFDSFSGGPASFRAVNPRLRREDDFALANWSSGEIFAAESGRFRGKLLNLNFFPVSNRAVVNSWAPSARVTGGRRLLGNALAYVSGGPTLPPLSLEAQSGKPLIIDVAKLLRHASHPNDARVLIVDTAARSTENGIVTLDGDLLSFTPRPGFTGQDQFELTLDDGVSTTKTVITISVQTSSGSRLRNPAKFTPQPDGSLQVRFSGVPGFSYGVQRTIDLTSWTQIGVSLADSAGRVHFRDPAPPEPAALYRLVYPAR